MKLEIGQFRICSDMIESVARQKEGDVDRFESLFDRFSSSTMIARLSTFLEFRGSLLTFAAMLAASVTASCAAAAFAASCVLFHSVRRLATPRHVQLLDLKPNVKMPAHPIKPFLHPRPLTIHRMHTQCRICQPETTSKSWNKPPSLQMF